MTLEYPNQSQTTPLVPEAKIQEHMDKAAGAIKCHVEGCHNQATEPIIMYWDHRPKKTMVCKQCRKLYKHSWC